MFFSSSFSLSTFEPRHDLHAYRSSASRYCTATLRSFPDRCFECTHFLFFIFFALEAASIRTLPKAKSVPLFFYFVIVLRVCIPSTTCIFHSTNSLTLLSSSRIFSSRGLKTSSLLAFFSVQKIVTYKLTHITCMYHLQYRAI